MYDHFFLKKMNLFNPIFGLLNIFILFHQVKLPLSQNMTSYTQSVTAAVSYPLSLYKQIKLLKHPN